MPEVIPQKSLWSIKTERRYAPDGRTRLCTFPGCDNRHNSLGLCHEHYAHHLRGRLFEDGTVAPAKPAGRKAAARGLNSKFGDPSDWIYIRNRGELIRRKTGEQLPIPLAVTAFGPIIRTMIQTEEIEQVERAIYSPPGCPKPEDDFFNTYRKRPSMESDGKPTKLLPEVDEILMNLGGAHRGYLESWLAWFWVHEIDASNPGGCALVLNGVPGSGKGVLIALLKAIFDSHMSVISARELEGEYMPWVENKLLIVADELTTQAHSNREYVKNRLKSLVMPGEITINRKHVSQYPAYICARWLITSNYEAPLDIDENDRRYSVICSRETVHPDLGAFVTEEAPRFAANLRDYLVYRGCDESFHPMRPLMNDDRARVVKQTKAEARNSRLGAIVSGGPTVKLPQASRPAEPRAFQEIKELEQGADSDVDVDSSGPPM